MVATAMKGFFGDPCRLVLGLAGFRKPLKVASLQASMMMCRLLVLSSEGTTLVPLRWSVLDGRGVGDGFLDCEEG